MRRSAVIILMLALAGCAGGSRSLKIKGPNDGAKRVPINKVYPVEAQTGVLPS